MAMLALAALLVLAGPAQAQGRGKRSAHASARRHAVQKRHSNHRRHRRPKHPKHGSQGPGSPSGPTGSGSGGQGSGGGPSSPSSPGSGETPVVAEPPFGSSGSRSAPTPNVTCDLIASPSGSDAQGNGSAARPYQSVVKLDSALAPGQTGCLRGGTYGSTTTRHALSHSGTPTGQITITSYPGETATVVGWVVMEASYTTLAGLQIDGSNTFYKKTASSGCQTPSVTGQALAIVGSNDVFERNDYYESVPSLRGVGIGVGFWGNADNTTIRFNKIHDVGQCLQFDHLIYLSSGNNVQIYDNWLYNDHYGWGITVYPHPTNARIFSNVIDNAGSGINISDGGSGTNTGNKAWHNVVSDSFRVMGSSGHPLAAALVFCSELGSASTGNEIFENDSFANPDGISAVNRSVGASQLSLAANITSDPLYENAGAGNFAVAADSPVASWELWNGS